MNEDENILIEKGPVLAFVELMGALAGEKLAAHLMSHNGPYQLGIDVIDNIYGSVFQRVMENSFKKHFQVRQSKAGELN